MADYNSSYTGAQIDAGIALANTALQPANIIRENFTFSGSMTAGTSGTRGLQVSETNPHENDGYSLVGLVVTDVADSNAYFAYPFYSGGRIYCNFYRASGSAANPVAKVRATYVK